MTRATRLAAAHRSAVERGVRLTRAERQTRLREITTYRRHGMTLTAIGIAVGLSAERVRQLLLTAPR